MTISIVISEPKEVYHPGDLVCGFVRLSAGSTDRKVSINLYGISRTIAGGAAPYNERVVLCSNEEALQTGQDALNAGDDQWSFNVKIPEHCQPHSSQATCASNGTFFNDYPYQPLPPSFEDTAFPKSLSTALYRDEKGIIKYLIKAISSSGQEGGPEPETTTIPLNIRPWRASEHPSWDTTAHICRFQILPQSRRRSSITNIFHQRKGELQEEAVTNFSLRAKMATTLIAGKAIPIFLQLEHDNLEDTLGPSSTCSIRSINLTLTATTTIRGHSLVKVRSSTGESQARWEVSKQIGSKLNYSVAMQSGGILDVRSLIVDLVVPDSQTPSFATFNIIHIHSLKLKVELMYHDRTFAARFIVKHVIVLPTTARPTSPSQETSDPASLPTTQQTVSAYRLRHSVDDELEAIASLRPLSEEPPSFEAATSMISPVSSQPVTMGHADDPPPFDAVPATPPRRASLHPGDDSTLFDTVIGEEELPSYAREETY